MTHSEALARVAKLLRLAKSDNPNEAAVAAAMAQEIMDRFKLQAADVELDGKPKAPEPDEPIRNFGAVPLDTVAGTWRVRLAVAIAAANQCKPYLQRGICLIGRPSDVETCRYVYAWLAGEVERLAGVHARGNGRTWANNFRIGVVDAIAAKLREQHRATVEAVRSEAFATGGEGAIVLVQQSIARVEQRAASVENWAAQNMKLRAGRSSSFRSDFGAREAGLRAGQTVRVGAAKGGLTGGHKALGK